MSTLSNAMRPASRRHRRETAKTVSVVPQIVTWLDRTGDLCLAVAILIVPLTMAGVREVGTAVFICCSLLMGLTWAVQQILEPASRSRFSGAEFIVLGAVALVCLQLVRLPVPLLSALAPFSGEYLTTWGSADGKLLGDTPWQTVSLTPALTRSGLVLLIAYCVFFLSLVQRLRDIRNIDYTIRLVAISCSVMAVIGLAQLLFGNGMFLWIFEHPYRDTGWPAKGTFTNQNHFAHFLALGIGPLIWWWHSLSGNTRKQGTGSVRSHGFGVSRRTGVNYQQLAGVAIAVVGLAGLLSTSRGGIAALLIATLISLRVLGFEWRSILKLIAPVTMFVVLGALCFGTEGLEAKWESISSAASFSDLSNGRRLLWAAVVEAIPHFWMMGSGLGSHAEVYPMWLRQHFDVRFSHAECGYLQVLLELGLPGLLLLVGGIGMCGRWVWKTYRGADVESRKRITVLAAGLIVSVLHSAVDFVWYIPACMILTLVLAACACRCCQLATPERVDARPSRWPTSLAWILVLFAVPVGHLSASVAIPNAQSEHDWMCHRAHDLPLAERVAHLENCVRIDSSDCSAMSELAALYLHRFEAEQSEAANRMSTLEIKNTVQNVEFESRREVARWLFRAFGERTSDLYRALLLAKKSVHGQPLRGESYLVIARLGFLLDIPPDEEQALLQQALRLRPHSPTVLYHAGLALAETGDIDGACSRLSEAFALDHKIRPLIVRELALYLPATEFIQRIAPPADGLWYLFREYQRLEQPDQQVAVAEWYSGSFPELTPGHADLNVHFWQRSQEIFAFRGEAEKSLFCLKEAVAIAPRNFELRKQLALALLENGELEQSRKQLNWCHQRSPDDAEIETVLKRIDAAQNSAEEQ